MSFVVVTCPGCQRETLLDEIDGRGFCMYCGTALDTSKDESFDLPDMFGETVHMMVDMAKELDFTKEPWYEEVEGTLDKISAGEYARNAGHERFRVVSYGVFLRLVYIKGFSVHGLAYCKYNRVHIESLCLAFYGNRLSSSGSVRLS